MHTRPNSPSAFESVDPGVKAALVNMPPVNVTVLTCLHIDPSLSRPRERDRLRTIVRLAAANPDNDRIGSAYQTLRELWRRGFPVPAFDDSSLRLLPETEACRLLTDLRGRQGVCLNKPALEEAHIKRLLVLFGYDVSLGVA